MDEYNLVSISSRYLCGQFVVEGAHAVTWKKLKIASMFKSNEPVLNKLETAKVNYQNAVSKAKKIEKLSLQKFRFVNRILNDYRAGEIRNSYIVAGGTLFSPEYIAPHADKVMTLIEELLFDLERLSGFEKKYYLYSSLINIHPFYDGNGRTARAIFDSTFMEEGSYINPHFIYYLFGDAKRHFLNTYCKRIFTSKSYQEDLKHVGSVLQERKAKIDSALNKKIEFYAELGDFDLAKLVLENPILLESEILKKAKSKENAMSFLEVAYKNGDLSLKKYRHEGDEFLLFEFKHALELYNEVQSYLLNR
ncbi:hypothetical protein PSECIP111951_02165 [Pseudoalteromonas holothuriae]|uniref:Fido domain-containing protein n=1 Tax=Pseudoalteromonas holothuriae TaxID=2963714 RepID=A0ABM9GIJ0_9GAMM|nr:Fic family protein [Pseudoalteromonas sp. CIP111951]CAH9059914.1 hypothetical protein PSECIP111951_02165 [Pseudoalteromonas sp. CIP111951]